MYLKIIFQSQPKNLTNLNKPITLHTQQQTSEALLLLELDTTQQWDTFKTQTKRAVATFSTLPHCVTFDLVFTPHYTVGAYSLPRNSSCSVDKKTLVSIEFVWQWRTAQSARSWASSRQVPMLTKMPSGSVNPCAMGLCPTPPPPMSSHTTVPMVTRQ